MTTPYLRPSVGDWIIDTSWAVIGADGEKIGSVDEVHPSFLVVGKGFIIRREHYIPVHTITNVDRECVYLNVSSSDIEARGWNRIPDVIEDEAYAGAAVTG